MRCILFIIFVVLPTLFLIYKIITLEHECDKDNPKPCVVQRGERIVFWMMFISYCGLFVGEITGTTIRMKR
jgi:hypothetical protein